MNERETFFLRLIRENDASLRRLCRIYAPDADRRRDLYQEILVNLWRGLPGYRGDSRPGTWLYRVALNTALAFRRDGKWGREIPVAPSDLYRRDEKAQPAGSAERLQAVERLYTAIGELPDSDKALVLLYLDDVSYREMGEIMGFSESNVGVRLHRIRKRLGDRLTEGAA